MANNGQIKIQIGGDASQFTQAAGQAGNAAAGFGKAIGAAGAASEHAFDEIAAGAAAMDRITAAIGKMVGAALAGDTGLDKFASTAVKAITPLSTFERRLEEINTAIGRIGTVQGAAQLGVQFDILNRNLQSTRKLIDDATKSAVGLSRAFNTVASSAGSLNRLSPAIRPALTDLKLMGPTANTAADALKKLTPGANQATFALTNLGRIAQDAPFGLIGIANNIEPAIASFIALRKESGSVGATFKTLGSSLLGPGGLILGIGLASTVLTLLGQGFFKSAKAADDFKEAMEEANKGAAKEISQLLILTNIAADNSRSINERTAATKQLKNEFPEYFKQLSQEAILNGQVAEATDKAKTAILSRAKARAIDSLIAKETEKQLQLDLKRAELQRTFQQEAARLAKGQADFNRNLGVTPRAAQLTDNAFSGIQKRLNEVNKEYDESAKRINDLLAIINNEDLKNPFGDGSGGGGKDKQVDLLQRRIDALKTLRDETGLATQQQRELVSLEVQLLRRDGIKLGFTPEEIEERVTNLIQNTRFGREITPVKIEVPLEVIPAPTIDVAGSILPGGQIPANAFDGVVNALRSSAERAKVKATEIVIDLKELLSSVLTNAFIGLGESIGAAFQSGGFSNVFNGFINLIGEAVIALGRAAIQAGTAALIAKEAIQKFIIKSPALVIAAGVAAVAIGSALKNAFNNTQVPGFADGITNFSGGAALVGERGPEIVTLPSGANVIPNNPFDALSNITLASQIRGDDIYLSYNRTSGRRRRV